MASRWSQVFNRPVFNSIMQLDDGKWRNALMLGRDRTGFDDGQVNVYSYMLGARSGLTKQLDKPLRLRAGVDVLFESLKQEFDDSNENDFGEPSPPGDMMDPGAPGAIPRKPPGRPVTR